MFNEKKRITPYSSNEWHYFKQNTRLNIKPAQSSLNVDRIITNERELDRTDPSIFTPSTMLDLPWMTYLFDQIGRHKTAHVSEAQKGYIFICARAIGPLWQVKTLAGENLARGHFGILYLNTFGDARATRLTAVWTTFCICYRMLFTLSLLCSNCVIEWVLLTCSYKVLFVKLVHFLLVEIPTYIFRRLYCLQQINAYLQVNRHIFFYICHYFCQQIRFCLKVVHHSLKWIN